MQKTMRGLALLVSIAVLTVMLVDLRTFIVVKKIKPFSVDSPLAFIFLVAGALTIFLVVTCIRELRWLKSEGRSVESMQHYRDLLWVAGFMIAIVLYVYLVKYLHFLLTTFLFMILGMFLLNDSEQKAGVKFAKVLLAAGITVPILYAVFNYTFDVVLP